MGEGSCHQRDVGERETKKGEILRAGPVRKGYYCPSFRRPLPLSLCELTMRACKDLMKGMRSLRPSSPPSFQFHVPHTPTCFFPRLSSLAERATQATHVVSTFSMERGIYRAASMGVHILHVGRFRMHTRTLELNLFGRSRTHRLFGGKRP